MFNNTTNHITAPRSNMIAEVIGSIVVLGTAYAVYQKYTAPTPFSNDSVNDKYQDKRRYENLIKFRRHYLGSVPKEWEPNEHGLPTYSSRTMGSSLLIN